MLNQLKTILVFATLLVFFTACGEHNQSAPNTGKNLDNNRIYGESRETDPAQLGNEYEDPKDANEKSKAVYAKMYAPREVESKREKYPVETKKDEVVNMNE
jgi:hypothetical protein